MKGVIDKHRKQRQKISEIKDSIVEMENQFRDLGKYITEAESKAKANIIVDTFVKDTMSKIYEELQQTPIKLQKINHESYLDSLRLEEVV